MGTARRLPLPFKNTPLISVRLFSSSAALLRGSLDHRKYGSEKSDGESAVYKRALKLQRPTTVRYQENLRNSVSLIGVIDSPLKACNTAQLGVRAILKVRAPACPYRGFPIMLKFWGEMAEVSVQHLKPRDLIYVSGRLGSYLQASEDGRSLGYGVDVKEMNFVGENSPGLAGQNLFKLKPEVPFVDRLQRRINRLHLWHVFFANPAEWWDNRRNKVKPGCPDFKHKDTGEVLWLLDNDPPWINKQLTLLDSRSSNRSLNYRNSCSRLSPLVYDQVQCN